MRAMIICVCNAITEDEVRQLARSGLSCPQRAYQALGFEPQCGSCLTYAQEVMDEEREQLPRLRIVA